MRRKYCLTFQSQSLRLFWTKAGMIRFLLRNRHLWDYAHPFKRSTFWPHVFLAYEFDLPVRSTRRIGAPRPSQEA
jgi:hypothetical protein